MIYYLVTREHAYTMGVLLETQGRQLAGRIRIVPYEDLLAGISLPREGAAFIFSDLDRLARQPRARAAIGAIRDRLVGVCGEAKILNDPLRSLGRYELLRALHVRGINSFNVYRPGDGAVPARFPVFVRNEWGHRDPLTPLLRTPAEYAAAVAQLQARADPLAEPIAIEYCHTADGAGLFRKYAAFIVGERIIPRHVLFSRSWIVKAPDLAESSMLAEERSFVESDAHAQTLREIFGLARISYGRIDYGLLDGHPQIWEINTNPMPVSVPEEPVPERRVIHERFVAMLADALTAIDGGTASAPA